MELLMHDNIENICKEIYTDFKKDNIYRQLVSNTHVYSDTIIMKCEFICEISFKKSNSHLVSEYKPILVKNQSYFKYDFITEDSITILNNNVNFNKYYNFDRNYRLHCYIKNKHDKRLNMSLPTFIIAIEYKNKKCCYLL